MRISLFRPSTRALKRALESARGASPSLELADRFEDVAPGFRLHTTRQVVGTGPRDYEAAKDLVARWAFLPRWIRTYPELAPQDPGETLVVVANVLGVRFLLPTRILQNVEDKHGNRRGFVYSALNGHIAHGYERFIVDYEPETGDVTFDVSAVARATNPILRMLPPVFPRIQSHFRHSCMRQLRAAIAQQRTRSPTA